ncbi:hypothetical protein DW716_22345 [Absiella sp. AM27-20]|nr:hypothetical protein DW716_22345 [Absiella sp. AM27-20]
MRSAAGFTFNTKNTQAACMIFKFQMPCIISMSNESTMDTTGTAQLMERNVIDHLIIVNL